MVIVNRYLIKKYFLALLLLYICPSLIYAQTKKEPLFGKSEESYRIKSSSLKGAVFYLVSGHGGPDPGCIGKYQGKELHEDEYAYDIVLRLGKNLLERGAKVHFIIQDSKDGIRNTHILKNSKRETCMGKSIPLNQIQRLQQRCDAINQLYRKEKGAYKRAVFIHIDSRSRKKQTDVYFYHAKGSSKGKRLAKQLQSTFRAKYNQHQPGRGFGGTVSQRDLFVLNKTTPVAVFLELGNIQNSLDQQRLVIPDNRQALANWIAEAMVADYARSK